MSTVGNWRGPDVAAGGIALYYDPGSPNSYYNKTSTIIRDISGRSGTTSGSFVNGPIYNTDAGGNIVFDGSNDYIDFSASLGSTTTVTVEMWAKIGAAYTNKMFFGFLRYDVFCGSGHLGYNTSGGDVYGISSTTVSSLGLVNNWKHYMFEMRSDVSYTNNKIYINGVSQALSQQTGGETAGNRNFNSGQGRIAVWVQDAGYCMPMNCAIFKIYDRALTQQEVTQNFNAQRSRYGL
jgi:hypothetical protein